MTTREQINQFRAALNTIATREPVAVLIALLDELVESACGDNPALKDFNRMLFYRNLIRRLKERGIE